MPKTIIPLTLALCALAAPGAAAQSFPDVIVLPNGFGPEGIATGRGTSFFVGSRLSGAIIKGDLRTGRYRELVPPSQDEGQATGLKVDRRNRLFVSGAGSKRITVHSARTGALIRRYDVPEAGFINDVALTRTGAYFTDSQVQQLYRVPIGRRGRLGALQRIPITGDFVYDPGFNANGIAATPNGRRLIVVKSSTGELFTANARTGRTRRIDLGGASVTNGDGILLRGQLLYVVENRDNLVTVVRLSRSFARGRVVRQITDPDFAVPTTIAGRGRRLWVVNAKFGQESQNPPYEVVRVPLG